MGLAVPSVTYLLHDLHNAGYPVDDHATTVEEAEKYRNLYIKVLRDQEEELEEGSYYVVDILGCKVNTDANQELGKIVDVFQTGSNDVYVVKDEQGKQILLPAIKQVIKNVDIKNKIITIWKV